MKKLAVMMSLMTMLVAAVACADELAVGANAPKFSLVNAVDGKTVARPQAFLNEAKTPSGKLVDAS